jgi:phage repressor protein C with HTH and peptisase S24 domain
MSDFAKKVFSTAVKKKFGTYENFTRIYNQRFGADIKLITVKSWGKPSSPNNPTVGSLVKVAELLGLEVQELFEGYKPLNLPPLAIEGLEQTTKSITKIANMTKNLAGGIPQVADENVLNIAVVSHKASAGVTADIEGIDVGDTLRTMPISPLYFKTLQKVENLRVIQVDGYSMTPMLFPDNHVIFDRTINSFIGDGLYIINFRNIMMVKLLQVSAQGTLEIISSNKDYKSYETSIDDQSVFKIVGKVVKIII